MDLTQRLIDLIWESWATTKSGIENSFLFPLQLIMNDTRTMQRLVDEIGSYPTGETLTHVLWRSTILDDGCKEDLEFSGQWAQLCSMLGQSVDLCHELISFLEDRSPAGEQEIPELGQKALELDRTRAEVSTYISKIWNFGRSFSTTKRGYVGWVPKEARRGDEFWVFHGYSVPFVLRPAKDRQKDERAYTLTGDCYIHGLMGSEASARIAGVTQQTKLV